MSDELSKIRQRISFMRNTAMGASHDALTAVLDIIDDEIAEASRKPKGEWRFVPDVDDTFWAMKTQDEDTKCEVYLNRDTGVFSHCVFCYGYLVGSNSEHDSLEAAKLAAEEAIEKMGGKQ